MNRELLAQAAARVSERGRLDVWRPLPHQVAPPADGDWLSWWLVKGRGAGGTSAVTRWVHEHVCGPACDRRVAGGHRGVLIGPTADDVAQAMVYGPSGLRAIDPRVGVRSGAEGRMVVLPNRVRLRIVSGRTSDSVERIRASANVCFVAIDEAGITPYLEKAVELADGSLRLGPAPRLVGSTTPAPVPGLRDLVERDGSVVSRGRTGDNPYLPQRFLDRMSGMAGTKLGRQELDAEWVEADTGPLWHVAPDVREAPSRAHFSKTVVVIDPAGSGESGADETGIVVIGADLNRHLWVLDDLSGSFEPGRARDIVWAAVDRYGADGVVYEANGGKNWIRTVLLSHPSAVAGMVHDVWQDESKADRFEPVARLYWPIGGGLWHVSHAARFQDLESEMLTWRPGDRSPNRLDAVATGLSWLVVNHVGVEHYKGLFDGGRKERP